MARLSAIRSNAVATGVDMAVSSGVVWWSAPRIPDARQAAVKRASTSIAVRVRALTARAQTTRLGRMLRVHALGPLRIETAGGAIEAPAARRAWALLAWLALHPG